MSEFKINRTTFENMMLLDMASFKKFQKQYHDEVEEISTNIKELPFDEIQRKYRNADVTYMFILEALMESVIVGYKCCYPDDIEIGV